MNEKILERFSEHLLYETPEGKITTQLENMISISRRMVNILNNFPNPESSKDPQNPKEIMQYLKKETGISEEEIIMNGINNILKNKYNTADIGKKLFISPKVFSLCRTLLTRYIDEFEKIEDIKDNHAKKIVHTLELAPEDIEENERLQKQEAE